jgi:ribulose-phosphate 3-epimerase
MARRRTLVSASILDADLADLAAESRRALRCGADRLHLDVMDGHFVPNITFGATVIKRLRRIGKQPFDAHLMISEPSRYMDQFIDAGCDSITFHVEVDEPIEPTLRKIRKAGRQAGLAIKPATPLSALEPYRELIDIVMVMTVEPGFGGQAFMTDAARKILPAHNLFRDRAAGLPGGQVHVDGGANRKSAELCGGLAAEVLVVGSVLWKKGVDIGREIRLIKALADKGYENGAGRGKIAIPHDEWATFSTLPRKIGRRFIAPMEARGIPVVEVRAGRAPGAGASTGPRDCELLIPAVFLESAHGLFGEELAKARIEAEALRTDPTNKAQPGRGVTA